MAAMLALAGLDRFYTLELGRCGWAGMGSRPFWPGRRWWGCMPGCWSWRRGRAGPWRC
ncbi:hypothetical protein GT370_02525 [Acidocella sp. MX-AZ03]|uniref:hypothetical protein n=1 Tax=Acidocella sp. MX-AZ03 TaxID=2697363 RepID=UPI0022DD51AA|nr:hypothetical protein [Acidocella sp. MX-AZ03]WBO59793.1 hypothetical protein GT370_02525 [Acidocella sp. MX-AZ03]